MNKKTSTTLIFLHLSIATLVSSEILQVNPDKDNTLYETDFADTSNALGEYTFIGKTGNNAGGKLRRAVVRFDVSDIPANSTINSVSVSFSFPETSDSGGFCPSFSLSSGR